MKYRTIVKKDLPYLPLFKSDWLSSKKVRRCCASTRGVYADLLCVLHDEERHGCYSLHLQEEKWRKSRSKTNLALSKPDGYQRLPYFAEFLSRRIGDTKSVILKALKELYERKIIVVEGDSLIQPRMYLDSEYELLPETVEWLAQSEDHEIVMEPVTDGDSDDKEEGIDKGRKKASKKTTKKTSEKSRTRTDAYATRTESGSENKNINNDSMGNKGVVGENDSSPKSETSEKKKTQRLPSDTDRPTASRNPVADRSTTSRSPVGENPPTLDEVQAYFVERAAQGKPMEYVDPDEFYTSCETDGWTHGKDRKPIMNWKSFALGCETYRKNHGEPTIAERREVARQGQGREQPRQQRTAPKHRTSSAPLVTDRDADKYDEDI